MNLIVIGDVIGKPGRRAVKRHLPGLVSRFGLTLVIANGENLAGGFGLSQETALEMFAMGVDVLTTGNHIWDKKDSLPFVQKEDRVLRPANYPPGVAGRGASVFKSRCGVTVGVLNLAGRVFMQALDCPFRVADTEVLGLRGQGASVIVVDFHAEATSEKMALAHYLDGRVSAVTGTHTHVQTADERVLSGGTAYITDVGMTGPEDSVIGIDKQTIIERFLDGMPRRYEVSKAPTVFSAVVVGVDDSTGRADFTERIMLREDA